MNTEFVIFVVALGGLFYGWFVAWIHYRRKIVKLKKLHKEQTQQAWSNGWEDGWRSLSETPIEIHRLYHAHFQDTQNR